MRALTWLALPIVFSIWACSSNSSLAGIAAGAPSAGGAGASALGAGGLSAGGGVAGAANSAGAGGGGASGVTPSAPIGIVAGGGVDVPYQFDANAFGIQGAAFFARSTLGTSSIVLDKTQTGNPAKEQDSCALVTPTGGMPSSVLFSDMYVQCWDGPQGTAPNDPSMGLLDISVQVAPPRTRRFPSTFV